MKRFDFRMVAVVLTMACLALVGCKKDNGENKAEEEAKKPAKERLVGTWEASFEIDQAVVDKMKQEAEGPGAAMLDLMVEMLKEAKITIDLKSDGSATMTMSGPGDEEDKQEGTWKVIEETDNNATFTVADKNGEAKEFEIAADNDNSFTMKELPDEDMPVKPPVFKRVTKTQ